MRKLGQQAEVRQRIHPHAFRHALTVEPWHEGIGIVTISHQLGHANPAITMAYLQSLDPMELLGSIGTRKPPVMPVPHRG